MGEYERPIAGVFVGLASLLLIYQGRVNEALYLLLPTLAFFLGESNGKRVAAKKQA